MTVTAHEKGIRIIFTHRKKQSTQNEPAGESTYGREVSGGVGRFDEKAILVNSLQIWFHSNLLTLGPIIWGQLLSFNCLPLPIGFKSIHRAALGINNDYNPCNQANCSTNKSTRSCPSMGESGIYSNMNCAFGCF